MEETSSILTPPQRYAAAALFSLALHQSQFHQRPTPPSPTTADADAPTIADSSSISNNPELWIHDNSGLLFPIFRYSIHRY